jgi:type IV secretory pathway component VirB8
MKWVHLVATILFAAQIPVALLTGLKDSVPYLVFLSL